MSGAGGSVSCARRSSLWRGEHGGYPVRRVESLTDQGQQHLDGAVTGEMQQHPVFVLFDSGGDLEQGEDDGPGFRRSQWRTLQSQAAQLLVQDISRGCQQQAGEVGRGKRKPRSGRISDHFHLLD